MKKNKWLIISSAVAFALFFLLIILLKTVDVQETGIEDTVIGLSTVNFSFRDLIGLRTAWYDFTDYMGFTGTAIAFCFAVTGLVQWIKRKNIFKVDYEILALGVLYAVIIGTYFLFQLFPVNFRPVLLEGSPESSFPSSHTFVTCTIMVTSVPLIRKYFKDKKALGVILPVLPIILLIVTLTGRIVSGVHWFTDILGGMLLIAGFSCLYIAVIGIIKNKINQDKGE